MTFPYQEGSVFVIPLRSKGYALGVIARINSKKFGGAVLLGYFFGPKLSSIPSSKIIDSLDPKKNLKVLKFGDLSLLKHDWPIIGKIANWNRENWPLPDFIRKDDITKQAWRVHYSDDNLVEPLAETPVDYNCSLERDSMFGSGAIELLLTRIL